MSLFDQIAEQKIQAALQAGEFDHLAGKGKPLRWQENVFEPEEMRLANHLLRSNGFSLPWLELRKEILTGQDALAQLLARAAAPDLPPARLQTLQAEITRRIETLNRQILSYNLQTPLPVFHLRLISGGSIQPANGEG
jgi:hypothetical protein